MFHTFTYRGFGSGGLLLRSAWLFLLCALDAAGWRYSFQRHRWGEAAASAAQKRSVCFNADKADIFRGVSQTIPMKEQSPIWQCGRSEILSVMLNQNSGDKTRRGCISALIAAAPPINRTPARRRGLLRGKQMHFFKYLCAL